MIKIIANFLIKVLSKSDKKYQANFFLSIENSYWESIYNKYKNRYDIDRDFRFNGDRIFFYGKGKIFCKRNSYIGSNSSIQAYDGCKVIIGNNCSISHNVRIYTFSNLSDQDMDSTLPKKKKCGDFIIVNGVWIGANVFINPGVEIGDNVIVGANSVVTKSLDHKGIYGGVPAKLIKRKIIK
jgi:maltose O-acetyltransferase